MSITYEEALSTLESMFGAPWTREALDAVLRHEQGHMENTCDFILRHHGKDPDRLVYQLQNGIDPNADSVSSDAELARQLAVGEKRRSTTTATAPPPNAVHRGRGAPTTLPAGFLQIPGRFSTTTTASAGSAIGSSGATSTPADQISEDEKLARMLQDELFSQELARNPEFSHLGRRANSNRGGMVRASAASMPRNVTSARNNNNNSESSPPNVLKKIAELGDNAKARLQLLAAQFQQQQQQRIHGGSNNVPQPHQVAAHERRGLLATNNSDDQDDNTYEMSSRKDL